MTLGLGPVVVVVIPGRVVVVAPGRVVVVAPGRVVVVAPGCVVVLVVVVGLDGVVGLGVVTVGLGVGVVDFGAVTAGFGAGFGGVGFAAGPGFAGGGVCLPLSLSSPHANAEISTAIRSTIHFRRNLEQVLLSTTASPWADYGLT